MVQVNVPLFGLLQIRMPKKVSHIKKGLWISPAPSFIKDPSKLSKKQREQREKFAKAAKETSGQPLKKRLVAISNKLKSGS